MNGFEKHKLKHTSPSQINMWAECPAAWVARYLFDKRLSFGVAAQIGTFTERVVAGCLMGGFFEDEIAKAEKDFLKQNAFNTSEKDMKRISDIGAMAEIALQELQHYGEPEFVQKITGHEQQGITLNCKGDGWKLPVIGYLDFVYPQHGLIIDLKTTLRIPGKMSDAHARQAAIYSKAKGNMGVKFLYVSPKKASVLEVEDESFYLTQVKQILNRQEKMLRLLDKEQIKETIPLIENSFYWSGSEDVLKELYG